MLEKLKLNGYGEFLLTILKHVTVYLSIYIVN